MAVHIPIPHVQIRHFCRRHRIRRLSLFGSVLRPDFGPASDIDLLAEFEPGARVTLFDLVDMQDELAALLGREIDLTTPDGLDRYIRAGVLASAQVIYDREFAPF